MISFSNAPELMSLLTRSYEQLRQRALRTSPDIEISKESNQGLALLINRGLTAWIRTWSQYHSHSAPSVPAINQTQQTSEVVTFSAQRELAILITNMILSHPDGVTTS